MFERRYKKMRFNYRKIASVLASAVMLTSTVGFASAAVYPAPFSSTGGVVVYGADGLKTDVIAAIKVQNSIKATSTTSPTVSTSGESAALFTGSSKININDSLNNVKTVLTETELPTVLKKQSFSGNVDATITQTIDIGSNPRLQYAKQPTSSDDPALGFSLSTNTANYIYNASASFSRAVNFTSADSENREITLFGEKYTIGSATDSINIVLFKSSTKLNFDSSGTTSEEVTVNGKKYTIELVSASTSSATIKVTDEAGTSDQQQITTGSSRKVNGVSMAIITADSNNLKYTASLTAGADKITLTSGSPVTVGDSATNIDGTLVTFGGTPTNLTKITVSVAATSSEKDAIKPGDEYTDPVFGSFKVSMAGGFNIDTNSSARETMLIQSSGDDKLQVKLTNAAGKEATVQYIKTRTTTDTSSQLQYGDDGLNITVAEGAPIFKNEYVMVGNEDTGYLLKVSITNSSSDYANDKVVFTNAFDSSDTYTSVQSAEGTGTVTIGGKVYGVKYFANDITSQDAWNISLDYPDSPSTEVIVYPTFQTLKGAKAFLYEKVRINLNATTMGSQSNAIVSKLKFPNGNGYTDATVTYSHDGEQWNISNSAGTVLGTINTSRTTSAGATVSVGQIKYYINGSGSTNSVDISLVNPTDNTKITQPAFGIIEEKDDNSAYNVVIVTTTPGTTSTNATRVDDVRRTWSADATFNAVTWASNSNKASDIDLFGTIGTKDSGDSNHPKMEISYPDEQIYANAYITKNDAVVTPGGGTGSATGGLTAIEDSLISSYQDSNLIVVGGSCVNKVAAKILESEDPICGADFTTKTQVGLTQYIIKTVKSPYNEAKIAVLVAGYEAADTVSAVDKLLEGATTDVDTSKVYPELTTG
jgi:hypothetical protein